METLAIAVRGIHFLGASLLVGVFTFLVVVGRPAARAAGPEASERFAPLDGRLMTLGLAALGATLASGHLDLWRQVAVATGQSLTGSLSVAAFAMALGETRYGTVWLVRHALLILIGGLLLLRESEGAAADWLAIRLEAAVLAAASLGIIGAAGHAASTQVAPAIAIAVDSAHLLATGVWLGGLIPLAAFLRWSLALPNRPGLIAAATATRRFSALGLASVAVLAATGSYNAWQQVAGFPALFATPYGQWLCLKLLLLVLLLVTAAVNLLVLRPRLIERASAASQSGDRALVRRLRRQVLVEVALGCAILGVVAVLGLTTPARHAPLTWPFSFRFSWQAMKSLPGVQTRVAVGSQLAMLGLVAALLAVIVRRRRWGWSLAAGVGALALGLAVALPALSIDANPATYRRPTVPYAVTSINAGRALYGVHCASCHGVAGYGDGPAAAALRPRPADLTAKHTGDHTAGDLFWWLSHGIPGSAMPGFADRLSVEERWDVINFLRTLAAAEEARGLGPVVDPKPSVVAPDFVYTTGVPEEHALRDFRGRDMVLLVLFSLPGSLERLIQLSDVYPNLRALGAQVLTIPLTPERDLYRKLGPRLIFFPFVVEGSSEIVATFTMFRRDTTLERGGPASPIPPHMELLIDRQGYLRARWIPVPAGAWADPRGLLAEIERLAREVPQAPVPGEHIH